MSWGRVGSRLCLWWWLSISCFCPAATTQFLAWPLSGPPPLSPALWLTLPTGPVPGMVTLVPIMPPALPVVAQTWQLTPAPEGWSWRRARPELNLRTEFGYTSLRIQGDRVKLRVESLDRTQQWQLYLSKEQIRMEYRWRF